MNIVTILNTLKAANMISNTEEGISLFSDCFNKFGISLLLLNDEDKFSSIVQLLKDNKIPLQKSNGIYNLRVFAVQETELKRIINLFKDLGELDFLRQYPEMLTAPKNINTILTNMKRINQSSYKKGNNYNLEVLLMDLNNMQTQSIVPEEDLNSYLKTILHDKTLVDKVENKIANTEEDDYNVALELQRVENNICEEYLFPADEGWKIIIDQKEVNTFKEVKNTINTIVELNIPTTYNDALLFVLFYKSPLQVSEIKDIIEKHFSTGGI